MECYDHGPIVEVPDQGAPSFRFDHRETTFAECRLGQCEECGRHYPVGCRCGELFQSMLTVHDGWNWRHPTGVDYQTVRCESCGTVYLRRFAQSRIDYTGDKDEYAESITIVSLGALAELLLRLERSQKVLSGQSYAPFPGAIEVARQFGSQELMSLIQQRIDQLERRLDEAVAADFWILDDVKGVPDQPPD